MVSFGKFSKLSFLTAIARIRNKHVLLSAEPFFKSKWIQIEEVENTRYTWATKRTVTFFGFAFLKLINRYLCCKSDLCKILNPHFCFYINLALLYTSYIPLRDVSFIYFVNFFVLIAIFASFLYTPLNVIIRQSLLRKDRIWFERKKVVSLNRPVDEFSRYCLRSYFFHVREARWRFLIFVLSSESCW